MFPALVVILPCNDSSLAFNAVISASKAVSLAFKFATSLINPEAALPTVPFKSATSLTRPDWASPTLPSKVVILPSAVPSLVSNAPSATLALSASAAILPNTVASSLVSVASPTNASKASKSADATLWPTIIPFVKYFSMGNI